MPVKIKFHERGFEQLLRHPRLKADLLRRAERIRDAAGGEDDGFVARSGEGATRSRAAVIAASYRARRANAKSNVLVRSIDAGR